MILLAPFLCGKKTYHGGMEITKIHRENKLTFSSRVSLTSSVCLPYGELNVHIALKALSLLSAPIWIRGFGGFRAVITEIDRTALNSIYCNF